MVIDADDCGLTEIESTWNCIEERREALEEHAFLLRIIGTQNAAFLARLLGRLKNGDCLLQPVLALKLAGFRKAYFAK